jgi:hypothetical protein
MTYQKLATQPGPRAADATQTDQPGLYPGEVAVTLQPEGIIAAVYVDASPTDNNAGTTFYASARAINADGSTRMCGAGKVELVTEAHHSACHAETDAVGAQAIADELVKSVLGEPMTMVDSTDEAGNPVQHSLLHIVDLDQRSIRAMVAASNTAATIGISLGE